MIKNISFIIYKILYFLDFIIFKIIKRSFLIWIREFIQLDSYKSILILDKKVSPTFAPKASIKLELAIAYIGPDSGFE